MTQVNKISTIQRIQHKVGDRVACDFYPDQTFTIVAIQKNFATVRGKTATTHVIKLSRLRKV